ncbi:MAG TPA: o-succinylbenzoate synthase [Blastocatellia bacterium]|nr:o-succinylbenzoate synthase [Blastocatellia bacterium]
MDTGDGLNLERIQLRMIELPLRWPFETSFGCTNLRRIIIVKVWDRSGAFGYGECTAGEDPFYNHETADTAWLVIVNYCAGLLSAAKVGHASEVAAALERIRGNLMAKGALEAAIWDLEARLAGLPLWKRIGGTRTDINCGVSIGLQATTDLLLEKVDKELTSGYQRIKIKIKPGRDLQLVKAIRDRYPAILLSVDANAAYQLADMALMRELDQYRLLMIEQPFSPGDLVDHAKLQRDLTTAICLDESILSLRDARQAVELGSCKIINIKLGRVGGYTEAIRIHGTCLEHHIPVWCGGMLESGIGRAHNVALSTLAGFTLPGDVSASERYWDEDIVEPAVTVSNKGKITPPSAAGIGYEVNEKRVDTLTTRREEIRLQ